MSGWWLWIFLAIALGGLVLLIWVCEKGDELFDLDETDALRDDQLDSVGTSSVQDQIHGERVRRSARWEDRT